MLCHVFVHCIIIDKREKLHSYTLRILNYCFHSFFAFFTSSCLAVICSDGKWSKSVPLWYWWPDGVWRTRSGASNWTHSSLCGQTVHRVRQGCYCHTRHLWMATSQHKIHGWHAGCQRIRVCENNKDRSNDVFYITSQSLP